MTFREKVLPSWVSSSNVPASERKTFTVTSSFIRVL